MASIIFHAIFQQIIVNSSWEFDEILLFLVSKVRFLCLTAASMLIFGLVSVPLGRVMS